MFVPVRLLGALFLITFYAPSLHASRLCFVFAFLFWADPTFSTLIRMLMCVRLTFQSRAGGLLACTYVLALLHWHLAHAALLRRSKRWWVRRQSRMQIVCAVLWMLCGFFFGCFFTMGAISRDGVLGMRHLISLRVLYGPIPCVRRRTTGSLCADSVCRGCPRFIAECLTV